MKNYYLKIMYPGATSRLHSYDKLVEAEYVRTEGNSLVFFGNKHGNIKCIYPANYTIIEKITENNS